MGALGDSGYVTDVKSGDLQCGAWRVAPHIHGGVVQLVSTFAS